MKEIFSVLVFLSLFMTYLSDPIAASQLGSIPDHDPHIYIVHVEPSLNRSSSQETEAWHASFLPNGSRLLYSYQHAISGFAATLTVEELVDVKSRPGFLHAYPDGVVELDTTRSPEFLGLERFGALWHDVVEYGRGVIIGFLDTGIDPDHASFSPPQHFPPPPSKWKGLCDFNGGEPVCNRKLVGARSFLKGLHLYAKQVSASARDVDGHGTHCAGTAAGMFVGNASINGLAEGTASGVAPYAHIASYKVCSGRLCADSDVLAGLDAAIDDGVDVLSLSFGGNTSKPLYDDSLAIGTFAAIQKGIFVAASAGNYGPRRSTLKNEAPWMLTVGAGSLDRSLTSLVRLGDGQLFHGQSAYHPSDHSPQLLPLVYPGSAAPEAATCGPNTLSSVDVEGKIVVCDRGGGIWDVRKGKEVRRAGGAGIIIASNERAGYTIKADPHVLPASQVSYVDGLAIKSYINQSSDNPTASIDFQGTVVGRMSIQAPAVAAFSSRGPSRADPTVLKPDIIGPGLNILAAAANTINKFYIKSGTSVAAAHLAGIAALVKSRHQDWSPAAIKSVIMSTASPSDNRMYPIRDGLNMGRASMYAVGAGHVNPTGACNASTLVYDLSPDQDYIPYLCGLYTDRQVSVIAGHGVRCSHYVPISASQLNYPSIAVTLTEGETVTVSRVVTNRGAPGIYALRLALFTENVTSVAVAPKSLWFYEIGDKMNFTVSFTGLKVGAAEGRFRWVSSELGNSISSPFAVQVVKRSASSGVESM